MSDVKKILNKENVSVNDLHSLMQDKPHLFADKRDVHDKFVSLLFSFYKENKLSEAEHDELMELFQESTDDYFHQGEESGADAAESNWCIEACQTHTKHLIDILASEKKIIPKETRRLAVSILVQLARCLETPDHQTKAMQWLKK